MLTIFFDSVLCNPVSYIWTKYSDFRLFGFYKIFQILQGIGYNKSMGILDNLENSWDDNFEFESTPMEETDNTGRKVWTKGPAVYDSLTVKEFVETCCSQCSCGK